MFTGIVEEIGKVISVSMGSHSGSVTISAIRIMEDILLGDSIAVNGVCLTASSIGQNQFTADVMAETMRRSTLGLLKAGSNVNLERAMAANGRFGGHIVSGHIDGTGKLVEKVQEENAVWLSISAPSHILRYVVEKGSVAIDGVSLTVAAVSAQGFQVSVIPHTKQETILLQKKPGDVFNLECDIIGKYVERFLGVGTATQQIKSKINSSFLTEHGYL